MEPVWNEVESFVRGRMGIAPRRVITPATRVEDDLGLTGDEAASCRESAATAFEACR